MPGLLNPFVFGVPTPPPSGYDAAVLADSPLVYLKLDETSGTTAADSSGNGHDATIVGSPTLGAATVMPSGGGAVTLDVATKRIVVPEAAWMQTPAFSIEAWVRTTDMSSYHAIGGRDGSSFRGETVYITDNEVNGYDGNTDHRGSTALSTSTPYHILFATDGTTLDAYINGTLEYSIPALLGWTTNGTNPNDLVFGASAAGSGGFFFSLSGDMSNAAYYGAYLNATQAAAHYAAR